MYPVEFLIEHKNVYCVTTETSDYKKKNPFVQVALLETNPYLLGLTIVVSIVHSIFEFLAFKNGKITTSDLNLHQKNIVCLHLLCFSSPSSPPQTSSSGTADSLSKACLCAPSYLEFSSLWWCCCTYWTMRPTLWCRSASSSVSLLTCGKSPRSWMSK